MKNNKYVFLSIYIVISGYAILSSLVRDISENGNQNLCRFKVIESIAPWSSGCFYKALFLEPELVTKELLEYENRKLNNFTKKEGLAANIRFYRLQLHQKYRSFFRSNFEDTHNMYLDYRASEHHNVSKQLDYIQHLYTNQLLELAQSTLNEYCMRYLPAYKKDLAKQLESSLENRKIEISAEECLKIAESH